MKEEAQIGWGELKVWLKEWSVIILVALASFSLIVILWPHTPMYKEAKEQQRFAAISFLSEHYWFIQFSNPDQMQFIMEQYNLTREDIIPRLGDDFNLTDDQMIKSEQEMQPPWQLK